MTFFSLGNNLHMHVKQHNWDVDYLSSTWLVKFKPKISYDRCVALLLTNIASTTWIKVKCQTPMLPYILCEKSTVKHVNHSHNKSVNFACVGIFFIMKKCFDLNWVHHNFSKSSSIVLLKWKIKNVEDLKQLQNIFHAIPNSFFGPMFHHTFTRFFCVQKYFNFINFTTQTHRLVREGYFVNISHTKKLSVAKNILWLYLCVMEKVIVERILLMRHIVMIRVQSSVTMKMINVLIFILCHMMGTVFLFIAWTK